MRIDALDDLAVELQHQAQHAVRRRMLRPEVGSRCRTHSPHDRRARCGYSAAPQRLRPHHRPERQASQRIYPANNRGSTCPRIRHSRRNTYRPHRPLAGNSLYRLEILCGGRVDDERLFFALDSTHAVFAFSSPGQRIIRPFPRTEEIERTISLRKLHGRIDHALLRFIITKLDIPGQREVFALRVAVEP
jgi:hypothetical protein